MTHSTPGDTPSPHRLSETDVRAIGERLLQEHRTQPPANPDQQLLAQRYELSPADEERVDAALAALVRLPAEGTMRAEREAHPEAGLGEVLAETIAASRVRFLTTELAVGRAMLDAAATTRDPASRTRRIANAWEAHDEVARHLASEEPPAFTPAEQEGLSTGLARLRSQLVAAS